jgi:hypothetical protein
MGCHGDGNCSDGSGSGIQARRFACFPPGNGLPKANLEGRLVGNALDHKYDYRVNFFHRQFLTISLPEFQ